MNQVSVRIAFVDAPDAPADIVVELEVSDPAIAQGQAWSEVPYLEALDPVSLEGSGPAHKPYVLDVKKTHFSWGADGAGASIVLAVANAAVNGVIGAATWSALVAAFRSLNQLSSYDTDVPFERDEAIARARWRIQAAYDGANADDLRLTGETHDIEHERWTLEFVTPGEPRTRYTVELGVIEGLPATTRISRFE
jgi:hypothetical protein